MLVCPHCGKSGISILDKFYIPVVLSVKCRACQQQVSVDAKKLVLLGIPWLAVIIVLPPSVGLMLLPVVAFAYIKWVPLVQK